MKLILIFVLLFSSLTFAKEIDPFDSCWRNLIIANLKFNGNFKDYFSSDFEKLLSLVEEALVMRSKMDNFYQEIKAEKDLVHLRAKDMETIRIGTMHYMELRKRLFEEALKYECLLDLDNDDLYNLYYFRNGSKQSFVIPPHIRIKMAGASLAAALTLYDTFITTITNFYNDQRLRRFIDSPDPGYQIESGSLKEIFKSGIKIRNRAKIRDAILFFEDESTYFTGILASDAEYKYLKEYLSQSPSYLFVKTLQKHFIFNNKFKSWFNTAWDNVADITNDTTNILSMGFGNTAGLIEIRKGKLLGDKSVHDYLKSVLQPLDIVMEKTPFRITDKFIPGHFGHASIWLGTLDQLKELGVLDDPIAQKYLKNWEKFTKEELDGFDKIEDNNERMLKKGHVKKEQYMLEALRDGIQINNLEHYMNIDDFAIFRPVLYPNESGKTLNEIKKETIIRGLRHIGKEYDFNFDVETTDKIVCSELVYQTFVWLEWPTSKTMGRYTISPDQVAFKSYEGTPLELILFYQDGKLIPDNRKLSLLKELVLAPKN